MSSIQHIFNELFAGKLLTIQCSTRVEYETLRTSLCKKNSVLVGLDLSNKSVVGRYNEDKQLATFQLAESRRAKSQRKWQIVQEEELEPEDNTPSSPDSGEDEGVSEFVVENSSDHFGGRQGGG
jgi:hypothetical protein